MSEVGVKQLTKKVKLAVFDRDLKAREFQMYDVTDDGSKIKVRSGGKRHFNPTFDNDSFVELPRPWWKGGGWERIYFARNSAKSCVKFRKKHNDLSLKIKSVADIEELIEAASGENPNPEAQYLLNEVLKVLETAADDDFLKADPEQILDAARADMIKNFGKQEQQTSMMTWIQLAVSIIILLKVMGVIT